VKSNNILLDTHDVKVRQRKTLWEPMLASCSADLGQWDASSSAIMHTQDSTCQVDVATTDLVR